MSNMSLVIGVACGLVWLPACRAPSTGESKKTDMREAKYPVAEVLRGLNSPKATQREATIDRLMRDGAKARPLVPALIQMLSNPDWRLVKTATVALGALGPAAAPAVGALLAAAKRYHQRPVGSGLQQKTPQQAPPRINRRPAPPKHSLGRTFRWSFHWTVKRIGKASVAHLVKSLKDRRLRSWAVNALSQMGKTAHTAGPALVALLRQQFVGRGNLPYRAGPFVHPIRTTANVALAVTMIRRALLHRDASVRAGAAWACDQLCSAPEVVLLLRSLKDPDPRVRRHAADALGRFPTQAKQIVPALQTALKDPSANNRTSIMRALGQLAFNATGRPDHQQVIRLVRVPLTAGLRDPNAETRAFALHGLGHLGSQAAPVLGGIMRALKDPRWDVRAAAAQALGKMGSAAKPAVDALIKALRDRADIGSKGEDPHVVRVAAMRALFSLGPVALPALKRLRRASRGELRRKIDLALTQIQKKQ